MDHLVCSGGELQFGEGTLVIEIPKITQATQRKVSLSGIGLETSRGLHSHFGFRQTHRSVIPIEEINRDFGDSQLAPRIEKRRIACHGLVQEIGLLQSCPFPCCYPRLSTKDFWPAYKGQKRQCHSSEDVGSRFSLAVKASLEAGQRWFSLFRSGWRRHQKDHDPDVWAQRCVSLRASMSCALTRIRLPARCTLPSSTRATPSSSPILRGLRSKPLR